MGRKQVKKFFEKEMSLTMMFVILIVTVSVIILLMLFGLIDTEEALEVWNQVNGLRR